MSEPTDIQIGQHLYPSLPLAYEFVQPSYEWAIQRSDKMEDRLQSAIVGVSGITIAIPTLGAALLEGRGPFSIWFGLAIFVYFLALWVGVPAQSTGLVRIVDPCVLHAQWLGKPTADFKADMIHEAGKDLRASVDLINARYAALVGVYRLAAIEVVFWYLWIVLGSGPLGLH